MKFALAAVLAGLLFMAAALLPFLPKWHRPILLVCVGATFIDVLSVHAAGVQLRPYQFVTLALTPALLGRQNRARRTRRASPTALLPLLVVLTLLCAFSLVYTLAPKDTLEVTLGQCYLLTLTVCVLAGLRSKLVTTRQVLDSLAMGATLSSTVALLQFVASYGGVHIGVDHVVGIPWHRPQGLMTEPDWEGLAAGFGLFAAYLRRPGPDFLTRFRTAALVINATGLLLSGARAAWIAALVTLVVFLLRRSDVRAQVRRLAPVFVVAIVGLGLFAFNDPSALSRLSPSSVLSGAGAGDQGSTHSRLGVISYVVHSIPNSPVIGFGAGSLAAASQSASASLEYGGGGQLNSGHGNANLEFTFLWDGGLILLIPLLAALVVWLRTAAHLRLHPGLFAVCLLSLLDFQFNNGIRLAFVWVLFACCCDAPLSPAEADDSGDAAAKVGLGELTPVLTGVRV